MRRNIELARSHGLGGSHLRRAIAATNPGPCADGLAPPPAGGLAARTKAKAAFARRSAPSSSSCSLLYEPATAREAMARTAREPSELGRSIRTAHAGSRSSRVASGSSTLPGQRSARRNEFRNHEKGVQLTSGPRGRGGGRSLLLSPAPSDTRTAGGAPAPVQLAPGKRETKTPAGSGGRVSTATKRMHSHGKVRPNGRCSGRCRRHRGHPSRGRRHDGRHDERF
jgi:hypothetical protein